jgi:site-specific recombinase XerD
MKELIPSSSNGQAHSGADSSNKNSQPLSYKHRPDVGCRGPDPLTYEHRFPSLAEYARLLALRYDHARTRQSYYRQLRLIMDHFDCDPASLTESRLRDYFLHVKTVKLWRPKTVRQAAACARLFFVGQLGHEDWRVFSQIRARDQDRLPAVLTREQVTQLLCHIRLRRYRIPIKLIYCCGLRLSECLNLTIHDIRGNEGKLWVRSGKGGRDRLVPVAKTMVEDLRRYWNVHRHPLLLFPNAGRGSHDREDVAARMHRAQTPMPVSSLQRLILVARKELNLPEATVHTLRHSFATHLIEAGAPILAVKDLLGHQQINTTMIYLHLTHQVRHDCRELIEGLCQRLPR